MKNKRTEPPTPLRARRLELLAALLLEGPARVGTRTPPAELAALTGDDPAWTALGRELNNGGLAAASAEHAALFSPNGPESLVPYGSRWGVRPVLGGLLPHLQRAYDEAGFDPAAAISAEAREALGHVGLVHDHAGVMLACTAHLLAGDEPAAGDAFAKRFLAPWLPAFGRQLRRRARTPLFKALGDLLTDRYEA